MKTLICSFCGSLVSLGRYCHKCDKLCAPQYFNTLTEANKARQKECDSEAQITPAYRGNELAGETGEACNVIKKLERERLGIAGSRDTVAHLGQELADVVICAYLCAMDYPDIDLDLEIAIKFNATSEKIGFKTRITVPR